MWASLSQSIMKLCEFLHNIAPSELSRKIRESKVILLGGQPMYGKGERDVCKSRYPLRICVITHVSQVKSSQVMSVTSSQVNNKFLWKTMMGGISLKDGV